MNVGQLNNQTAEESERQYLYARERSTPHCKGTPPPRPPDREKSPPRIKEYYGRKKPPQLTCESTQDYPSVWTWKDDWRLWAILWWGVGIGLAIYFVL